MGKIIKCPNCDHIDYLAKGDKRCPKCGAKMTSLESDFAEEFITVTVMNTRAEKNKVKVGFPAMSKQFDDIMRDDLKEAVPEEAKRSRLTFMMKVYVWLLLNKTPQLWLHMDTVLTGLKELFTLRMQ